MTDRIETLLSETLNSVAAQTEVLPQGLVPAAKPLHPRQRSSRARWIVAAAAAVGLFAGAAAGAWWASSSRSEGTTAAGAPVPPVESLRAEQWLYPSTDGLDLEYTGASTSPALRSMEYGTSTGGVFIVAFGEAGAFERPSASEKDEVVIDGATWQLTMDAPNAAVFTRTYSWGQLAVFATSIPFDHAIDFIETLEPIDASELPRPVLDLTGADATVVTRASKDGVPLLVSATTDGERYAFTTQPEAGPSDAASGSFCCATVSDDQVISISGGQGPEPTVLARDDIADFLVVGAVTKDASEVRVTMSGTTVSVTPEDLSREHDVSFFAATIPVRSEELGLARVVAIALDADGHEIGRFQS